MLRLLTPLAGKEIKCNATWPDQQNALQGAVLKPDYIIIIRLAKNLLHRYTYSATQQESRFLV